MREKNHPGLSCKIANSCYFKCCLSTYLLARAAFRESPHAAKPSKGGERWRVQSPSLIQMTHASLAKRGAERDIRFKMDDEEGGAHSQSKTAEASNKTAGDLKFICHAISID